MSREVRQQVKKQLTEACIVFTDEWFSACVEWLEEENPEVLVSVDKLYKEVYEQWLDANLQDMESKCLPPNLAQQELTTLKGKFTLQANSLEDVGAPAYDQLNKLKKKDTENATVDADNEGQFKQSWEPKPRRCLCMTLTDGTQEIKAFEATHLPQLNEGLLPGVKVQINGAILCRRGVLFLKPGNLRILGGSVDSLAQTNSVMNLLIKRITISFGAPAQGNQRSVPTTRTQLPIATTSTTGSAAASNNSRLAPPVNLPSSSGTRQAPNNTISARGRGTHRPTTSSRAAPAQPTPIIDDEELLGIDFDDDPFGDGDDAFMDIDEAAFNPVVVPKNNPPVVAPRNNPPVVVPRNNPPIGASRNNPPIGASRNNPPVAVPRNNPPVGASRNIPPVASSSSSNSSGRLNTNFQFEDTIELFDISDDFNDKPTIPVRSNPSGSSSSLQFKSTSKRPYQFIKWVNDNLRNYGGATVYVKACVSTLSTNVGIKAKKWNLTININDGTGFMIVDVCPQLLEKLMGYNATEFKRLICTGTPAAAAIKDEAANKLRKTLVHMNGIFAVQICDPRCIMKAYEPVNLRHVRQLSDRLAVRN